MRRNVIQYFLNHRLELPELERQVNMLADSGIGGLCGHARQGLLTPYMSDDWWRAIECIMNTCRKRGMEFWIWDEDYFPSGLAGGRVVWNHPHLRARGLEFTTAAFSGAGPFEMDFGPGVLLRAYAIEKTADGLCKGITDITQFCGTRRQTWTNRYIQHAAYSGMIATVGHPHWRCGIRDNQFAVAWQPRLQGEYEIVGVTVVPHGGVHPDMLNPQSVREFIRMSYEPYFQRYGGEFGKAITAAFTDEPSPGGFLFPWTDDFPSQFRADHGYDLLDHLPHLATEIDDTTPVVRHHYRLTQHRLQKANYVDQIAHWCREHGIAMSGHLTRTEWLTITSFYWPNELRCYQSMDIPAADPLTASCAWKDVAYHAGLKVASSAAHLFGKPQASSDALAVIGDEAAIRDMKYMLDYQMVLGINHFVLHGASYSLEGPRKDEVPPSLFYQHTEWLHMGRLWDYLQTTCGELARGAHACQIAMLYPSTSLACQLKPPFNHYRLDDEAKVHELIEQMLSRHCDFDFIDEVTLQEGVLSDGRLGTPEKYKVVILPHLRYVDEKTAEALARFARAGGQVLAVETIPAAIGANLAAPSGDWAKTCATLHAKANDDFFRHLPSIDVSGDGADDVLVLVRQTDEGEVIFAFNRREKDFRGKIAGNDVFIVARGSRLIKNGRKDQAVEPPRQPKVVADLSGDWRVTFDDNHAPLNFWHVVPQDDAIHQNLPINMPGIDLMMRQEHQADKPFDMICRFMQTGDVSDMRIVMDSCALDAGAVMFVNGKAIDNWRSARVFDCRNVQADIRHALRTSSTPSLNIIKVRSKTNRAGLTETPYLYGSFECEYRYAHLSLPFVRSAGKQIHLQTLSQWGAIGYPTYSGSATYVKDFEIGESCDVLLDLGRVEDAASVKLDGREVAVLAWPPYLCRLGRLSAGRHKLEIVITNCPGNRNRAANLPSGLLGPVVLLARD